LVNSDRTRRNGLSLSQGSFRLEAGRNFFSERVVMQWHRLPTEVVKSPFLEVFKSCGDGALREVVGGHGGMGWDWTW